MMQHFLDTFFNPKSVALVGASTNPRKMSFHMVQNLVKFGFAGKIYPVNPNVSEFLGLPAYQRVKDIPYDVELVACGAPLETAPRVFQECVEKKVKGVIIITGGFSEAGEDGVKLQQEVAQLLKQNGIRALGPNSLGPVNTANNFLISIQNVKKLTRGGISFIFQSGFYELRINWILSDFHLGVNKIVDLGNKMDINEVEALEYLSQDATTEVIGIHLESLKGDGREFARMLSSTAKKRPVVVLKSGCTPSGSVAALSHTGAMARESDVVFDALLKQAGVVRAESIEDIFDFTKALGLLTPPQGNRIVVSTISGGEGVITTDWCYKYGFAMAKPATKTVDKLRKLFPSWDIPLNPFDYGPSQYTNTLNGIYQVFLEAMLADDNVDCVAIQLPVFAFYQDSEDIYKSFLQVREQKKPVVVWRTGLSRRGDKLVENLEAHSIPVYHSGERAIRALHALLKYRMMHQW